MDVLDQFDAFQALSKQGQSAAEIAQHFGVTEKLVHQRLAIAGLYEPVKNAFRNEEFGADTLQILTMATTRQQRDWYKLLKSDEGYAPKATALKAGCLGVSKSLSQTHSLPLKTISERSSQTSLESYILPIPKFFGRAKA